MGKYIGPAVPLKVTNKQCEGSEEETASIVGPSLPPVKIGEENGPSHLNQPSGPSLYPKQTKEQTTSLETNMNQLRMILNSKGDKSSLKSFKSKFS